MGAAGLPVSAVEQAAFVVAHEIAAVVRVCCWLGWMGVALVRVRAALQVSAAGFVAAAEPDGCPGCLAAAAVLVRIELPVYLAAAVVSEQVW